MEKKKFIFPWKTVVVNEQGCRSIVFDDGSINTIRYLGGTWEGEQWKGHRLSHHLNNHPIPRKPKNLKEGLILHSCGNPWCVEPSHLREGTQKENMSEKDYSKIDNSHLREINLGNKYAKGNNQLKGKENPKSEKFRGSGNPFFGKKHDDKTKEKIIQSNIRRGKAYKEYMNYLQELEDIRTGKYIDLLISKSPILQVFLARQYLS